MEGPAAAAAAAAAPAAFARISRPPGRLVGEPRRAFLSVWPKTAFAIVYLQLILAISVQPTESACSVDQFACGDNTCIEPKWVCDGVADCKNSLDEKNCPEVNCTSWQMKCNNGRCILADWKCDGQDDCGDASDEDPAMCAKHTCEAKQFACKTPVGRCLPEALHCDGRHDCTDGSDEIGCDMPTCSSEEFRCANGGCVSRLWVCDGDEDCDDSSDEASCPERPCAKHEFRCGDGKCMSDMWRCDGRNDCRDGSDEVGCGPSARTPNITCKSSEFRCSDGTGCIRWAWRCDGEPDCRDKSDELNCTSPCRPDQFQCKAGECVAGHLECDGHRDCPDDSDEHDKCYNITVSHRACDKLLEFDCGQDHCIPLKAVCDGNNDCGAHEDEGNRCNVNECSQNNGGCQDACVDLPLGFRCECRRPGFKLASDATSCMDIDECLEVPGICSQFCNNTKGAHKCSCSPDYILEPDTGYCRARGESPKLLFANRHDVRIIDLVSNEYRDVVSGTHSAVAVDYVFSSGTIVWADAKLDQISRAKMHNNISTVIVGRKDYVVGNIDGIAVDWIHNKIYWTDTGRDAIFVAELLDGRHVKTLFSSHLQEPRAIAVDPLTGWLFWADWGVGRIEKAGMDGTHRSTLIDTDIKWPNGLAIDRHDNKLYWIDAKMHLISRCNLNGGDRRTVLSSREVFAHPFSIDVFEDWIYWSDWHMQRIYKINKFTGQNLTTVSKPPLPMDLVVVHELRQPKGPDRCANNTCEQLCLAAPSISAGSPLYSCLCADGHRLVDDGMRCERVTRQVPDQPGRAGDASGGGHDNHHEGGGDDAHGDGSGGGSSDRVAEDGGRIAGMVIAALSLLGLIVAVASFLVYRRLHKARHLQSMNFDNPVYRKTTEDQFSLEKPDSPLAEPLTSPGTNDFV